MIDSRLIAQVLGPERVQQLRERALAAPTEVDGVLIERMLKLAPLGELAQRVEQVTAQIDTLKADGGSVSNSLTHILGQLQYDLGLKRLYEDLAAERRNEKGPDYRDCWCLGQGGRDEVGLIAIDQDGRGSADGTTSYREICSCPDGQAVGAYKAEQTHRLEQEAAARRHRRILGQAHIDPTHEGLTVESWVEAQMQAGAPQAAIKAVKARLREWWSNAQKPRARVAGELPPPRLLVLGGNYGAGKTTLASALVQAWIERERWAAFRTSTELFGELRETYRRVQQGESEAELLKALCEVELLALDDLGAEKITDDNRSWLVTTLLEILEARQKALLPTILTTNLGPEEIAQVYGDRMAQRILPTRMVIAIDFDDLANLRGIG